MNKRARLPALPYLVWVIGSIIIPLALVFVFGLADRSGVFTLDNVISIVERNHLKALELSPPLSFVSMLICFLLVFPLVLILRGKKIGRTNSVVFTFILPIWMNFPLRTPAWQTLLERNGVTNGILGALHLPSIAIINTLTTIVLDVVYSLLPFMVFPFYDTMCKIEDSVVEAARDLGASPLQTLWRTWLPLLVPGTVNGVTMVFVPTLMTFVISSTPGGNKILLIGNVIETEFTRVSSWNLGSGLPIAMLVLILLSMAVLAHYDKNGEGAVF